jgi:hypothetical protein
MLVDSKILALVSSLTWAAPLTGLDRPGHDHDRIIGVHPLVCIPTSYRHASHAAKFLINLRMHYKLSLSLDSSAALSMF